MVEHEARNAAVLAACNAAVYSSSRGSQHAAAAAMQLVTAHGAAVGKQQLLHGASARQHGTGPDHTAPACVTPPPPGPAQRTWCRVCRSRRRPPPRALSQTPPGAPTGPARLTLSAPRSLLRSRPGRAAAAWRRAHRPGGAGGGDRCAMHPQCGCSCTPARCAVTCAAAGAASGTPLPAPAHQADEMRRLVIADQAVQHWGVEALCAAVHKG